MGSGLPRSFTIDDSNLGERNSRDRPNGRRRGAGRLAPGAGPASGSPLAPRREPAGRLPDPPRRGPDRPRGEPPPEPGHGGTPPRSRLRGSPLPGPGPGRRPCALRARGGFEPCNALGVEAQDPTPDGGGVGAGERGDGGGRVAMEGQEAGVIVDRWAGRGRALGQTSGGPRGRVGGDRHVAALLSWSPSTPGALLRGETSGCRSEADDEEAQTAGRGGRGSRGRRDGAGRWPRCRRGRVGNDGGGGVRDDRCLRGGEGRRGWPGRWGRPSRGWRTGRPRRWGQRCHPGADDGLGRARRG